jgi:Ca-activated chloride channel family protein
MASQAFENDPDKKKNKAIIVISDGENFEDNAVEMAKKAVSNGIIVSTIGMGLPEGAPIPNIVNGRNVGYKYDRQGQVVITKLNEEMLQEIAGAGEGIYTGANNISTGIEKIFDDISRLDKKTYDSKNYSDFETKFQYILWIVIALLIADIFIFEKKNKFFMRIKLFD